MTTGVRHKISRGMGNSIHLVEGVRKVRNTGWDHALLYSGQHYGGGTTTNLFRALAGLWAKLLQRSNDRLSGTNFHLTPILYSTWNSSSMEIGLTIYRIEGNRAKVTWRDNFSQRAIFIRYFIQGLAAGGFIRVEVQESVRVATLRDTGLLDTPTEAEFDDLVKLAAEICSTPMGSFTLIDEHRQWSKASIGLADRESPREISLCNQAIQQREMFIVEDASRDARFVANPFVTGKPHIRFYAGVPLEGTHGAMLGTLCVMDTVPRLLSDSQKIALKLLAEQVRSRIELRSERRKLEEAVRTKDRVIEKLIASDHRFRTFMNNAPFVTFIKDAESRFLFYNDRLAERFKITSHEWLGKNDFDIWTPEVAAELRRHDVETMNGKRMIEQNEETSLPGQEPTCWKTYKFPWWNEHGETMLGGFAIDLTEETARQKALKEANLQLEKLATVDTLTGLANRRALDQRVEFEYRFALRHKTAFSVVMLDLDDFKSVNDQQGHAGGDEVLRQVGHALATTMRTLDLAARYGGEEFVVLLPGADTDGAVLFCERFRKVMKQADSAPCPISASLGIAAMDATTISGQHLIQRADEAMYVAKRSGKDRVMTHRDIVTRVMAECGGCPQ
jgi:diguanylate cyclase (GGDEF)-like protein